MQQVEQPKETPTNQRLGNVAAAAKVLDVPKSWLYERTRRDAIPADVMFRLGKYVRFDLDRLWEWAKAGCPER